MADVMGARDVAQRPFHGVAPHDGLLDAYLLRLFNGRLTYFVGPNKLYIVISHLATAPYMSRCIAWRSRLR